MEPKLINPKKILFIVNDVNFFMSHRSKIAIEAIARGYEVHVVAAPNTLIPELEKLGITYHPIRLSRSGINPASEIKSLFKLYKLLKNLKPDLVHLVTIKPVLYGGLAARLTKNTAVVAAISGLGSVFVAQSIKGKVIKWLILNFYKFSLKHKNLKVIFQNTNDRKILVSEGVVSEKNTLLIPGSGVDLSSYKALQQPTGTTTIIFASRLLKEKGVINYIDAIRIIRSKNIDAKFLLAGSPDPGNPSSVTQTEVNAWIDEGLVDYLGYRSDIANLFSQSNIVVLPSFYGEGLPKVLIEAAACARAIITTNCPGCRDAIVENVSGILIEPQNTQMLADAIEKLIKDPELRNSMGLEGRKLAEAKFDITDVVNTHLQTYHELASLP